MKNTKNIWIIWAITYVICTVCAFFPASNDAAAGLFLLLSLGFFVPPGFLIYKAVTKKWPKILQVIRTLSIISLASTLVMILLNFVSVQLSEAWGTVLYVLLILVSTPMVCSQVWVIGLFGWAVLLFTCLTYLKNK